jgi:CHASE2 domain-containing sensor protein
MSAEPFFLQGSSIKSDCPVNLNEIHAEYVTNRIVILGDYSSRDRHDVPAGKSPVPGAAILTHAVQSELAGQRLAASTPEWIPYVLHVLGALLVVVINRKFPPFWALGGNMLILPAATVVFSYIAFHSLL